MPQHNFSTIGAIRIVIGVLACALAILLEWQRPEFLVRIDEGLRDAFIQLTADQAPEDRLVVIDIDEATLEKIGPWPWPRQRMVDLVEILLASYGARAVALEIVFPEPGDKEGDAWRAALAVHAPLHHEASRASMRAHMALFQRRRQHKLAKHKTTSLGPITLRGKQTTIEVFTVAPD